VLLSHGRHLADISPKFKNSLGFLIQACLGLELFGGGVSGGAEKAS
jgi:hypothetical protein